MFRVLRLGEEPNRKIRWLFGGGVAAGVVLLLSGRLAMEHTSSDQFCDRACHVHPQATQLWIKSTHFSNKSGVISHCTDCHLPAGGGVDHYLEKARLGVQDVYGKLSKDAAAIDWQSKRMLDRARTFTFDSGCIKCHVNLFSKGLSKKGTDAHLHYQRSGAARLHCINCHLNVGHFSDQKPSETEISSEEPATVESPEFPLTTAGFGNYTQAIPGSGVKLQMVAVPGGSFLMGSPATEAYRRSDEGPVRRVAVSSFWMGRAEVSWREFDAYYGQRGTRSGQERAVDAVTGPTPPYGSPDQGWGRGGRPAVTMTHHAAIAYCEWLSDVTGKKYRLPTEAEWEYACRAGTTSPYFFEGDPAQFTARSWLNRILGVKTQPLADYARYETTSQGRTHLPGAVKPNPRQLVHMLGNVKEFCLDWYDPQAYAKAAGDVEVLNPRGPDSGKEHVIRGGSFKSDAADLRSAARDHTLEEEWLLTDPQLPKSLWWYSDCNDVGFRVVREAEEEEVRLSRK
jgi:formylglycine-generating enzyme required for sulfatase activity/nitrate/TMAO reductase-like tetraheme cytochrome c subunit